MAGASLLALIDDIASVLDDVALMTKVAAKKTAGVLGDDLALNAQQVSGVRAERELPVVWAVAVGSLEEQTDPGTGGTGHQPLHPLGSDAPADAGRPLSVPRRRRKAGRQMAAQARRRGCPARCEQLHRRSGDDTVDLAAFEADKIKGAIRTDFVLSAEIVVIALGTVAGQPFSTQVAVLSAIGLLMTVGVYGVVGGIVKMDDLGLHLLTRNNALLRTIGRGLLLAAPRLMKALTVIGTAAMFLVGGGILTHGIAPLHHLIEQVAGLAGGIAGVGGVLKALTPVVFDLLVGLAAGALALLGVHAFAAARAAHGRQ
jgi:predicted DNA repair protein MutK